MSVYWSRPMNDLILCSGVAAFGVADFINPLPWYIPSKQKTKGSFDIFRVLRKKKLTWNWLEKFCRIARNANFKGVFCWLHFSYFQWTRLSRIFIKVFNCLCHDLIIAKLCACGLLYLPWICFKLKTESGLFLVPRETFYCKYQKVLSRFHLCSINFYRVCFWY